jgi:hypothetical protein
VASALATVLSGTTEAKDAAVLDNLQPSPKPQATPFGKPGVIFDGTEGEATTPYLASDKDFTDFLIEAGYDPEHYEVIGNPRTSKWQQREGGDWLTSYRFTFRLKTNTVDLPLLYSEAKKTKPKMHKPASTENALIVVWSDTQTGKAGDIRGGTKELIQRIAEKQEKLEQHLKKNSYAQILFYNTGDTIEGFESGGNPMRANDLSLMEQVDLEATFEWEMLRMLTKYAPVRAASVGSNHCAWRAGKIKLGNSHDDWGIHIQRRLAYLAKEVGYTPEQLSFYEPQPNDESVALDVFGDGSFIAGLVHGHQAGGRPEQVAQWWRGQSHGEQAVKDADLLIHGHWHHVRITETGRRNGKSRWLVMAPTLDAGSSWFRQTSGEDSDPGLLIIPIIKGDYPFSGTVIKL